MKSKLSRIGDILFEDKIVQDAGNKIKEVFNNAKNNDTLTVTLVAGEQLFKKATKTIKDKM